MKPHEYFICDTYLTSYPVDASFEWVLSNLATDAVTVSNEYLELGARDLSKTMRRKHHQLVLGVLEQYTELLQLALPALSDADVYQRIHNFLEKNK